jgi:thiol-disulfide isomerase/thioredoxin
MSHYPRADQAIIVAYGLPGHRLSRYLVGNVQWNAFIIMQISIRCGPCHAIAPAFEALSRQYTTVNFLKCDVDAAADVSGAYSISAMYAFY